VTAREAVPFRREALERSTSPSRNGGSGTARRIGTLRARGEIVVWTDADLTDPNERSPELVRMLLEPAGHEVLFAADGREGVEAARREKPDLVLMDLSLPVLSGWEATRQIKTDPETSGITVLAVTAHAMQGDRDRALAAGCDGFLSKPIDEEIFEQEGSRWVSRPKASWSRPSAFAAVAARGEEGRRRDESSSWTTSRTSRTGADPPRGRPRSRGRRELRRGPPNFSAESQFDGRGRDAGGSSGTT
jgi:CheY-like chemotaxis protein